MDPDLSYPQRYLEVRVNRVGVGSKCHSEWLCNIFCVSLAAPLG